MSDSNRNASDSMWLPKGAIAADQSKQAPNNSYDPPWYYVDYPFVCIDCGKEEVWTATQQKWYYEVAKGSIYARAIRCRSCRKQDRGKSGDPNPIKHVGSLIKRIRSRLEPALTSAGFVFGGLTNPGPGPDSRRLQYTRPGLGIALTFNCHTCELTAQTMAEEDGMATCTIIAVAGSGRLLLTDLNELLLTVEGFLKELPAAS